MDCWVPRDHGTRPKASLVFVDTMFSSFAGKIACPTADRRPNAFIGVSSRSDITVAHCAGTDISQSEPLSRSYPTIPGPYYSATQRAVSVVPQAAHRRRAASARRPQLRADASFPG